MLVLTHWNTTLAGVKGVLPNGELLLEPFASWDAAMKHIHTLEEARGRRTKFDRAENLDVHLHHAELRVVKLEDLEELLEYVGLWAEREPAVEVWEKLTALLARLKKQTSIPKPEVPRTGQKILERRAKTKLP